MEKKVRQGLTSELELDNTLVDCPIFRDHLMGLEVTARRLLMGNSFKGLGELLKGR